MNSNSRLKIPTSFVSYAATEMTNNGLTGPKLVEITSSYAVDYSIDIPHARYPFDSPNKRTALLDNLLCFSPKQQYQIIREMCDRLNPDGNVAALVALKVKLFNEYRDFADLDNEDAIHSTLIIEARHWLSEYPETKKLFDEALQKHAHGVFQRNTLDDLRLGLEILIRQLFSNQKSLENQMSAIGNFVKEKGGSPQLANMFEKLVDYYTKYQNTYVKHDDAVVTAEVEFVFELTSSFIKHFLRLKSA
ncbi:hypothetical protein [Undibacterium pigrum]|uniref:Uncharacterized protein n=1 Tax=Undibacterium pigrum TaxID=401470 RepID=A0A318J9N1_9BURK|nr:hypothetical protein [Undibacterium pigrum]PXX44019.1 hypothetical protein DFR42_103288 [Undibacterium pigrum]